MSNACIPILVGVSSPVSEIPQPSKMIKFPLLTMDIVHGHQKNLINRNRLKKIMQVGVDVTCMYTNFSGRDLSSFGDTATLKNGQISPSDYWTIVHGHQKI